jgi:hypothetical protein
MGLSGVIDYVMMKIKLGVGKHKEKNVIMFVIVNLWFFPSLYGLLVVVHGLACGAIRA